MSRAAPEDTVLEVVHETGYAYAAPVSVSHHLLHLMPVEGPRQRLLAFEQSIDPAPDHVEQRQDAFGNPSSLVEIWRPHGRLSVRSTSRVAVALPSAFDPAASAAWEDVRDALRYVAAGRFEPAVEFVSPSPHVPRLPELADWARSSAPAGRPVAAVALDLMQRVHGEFAYVSRSTDVDTPLAVPFAQRKGVCQDFAHVMIGALRSLGLPARYVSGYLLTHRPDGAALVGADASHAWVQVWCPPVTGAAAGAPPGEGADWIDLDPTNGLVVGAEHVRLAIGRDYADVAPLRGVIQGGGRHVLSVAVTTRRLQAPRGTALPPLGAPSARAGGSDSCLPTLAGESES